MIPEGTATAALRRQQHLITHRGACSKFNFCFLFPPTVEDDPPLALRNYIFLVGLIIKNKKKQDKCSDLKAAKKPKITLISTPTVIS